MLLLGDFGGTPRKNQVTFLRGNHGISFVFPNTWVGWGFRKAKKFNEAWMHRDPPKNASKTWKAIEGLKSLIMKGACFIVGDGAVIDIWKDPWVPWLPNFLPQPKYETINERLVVFCFINQSIRTWNVYKLKELFDEVFVEAITKIKIPYSPRPDRLVWILDPKGRFSVKLAFNCNQLKLETFVANSTWNRLWKLNMHERLKMFI
jgi:hypothetical protein